LGDSALAADACDVCCSIVVPVFNEEAVLPVLLRRLDVLMAELDGPAETISSTTPAPIAARSSCGHQVAISAGIDAGLRQIDTRYFVLLP
jgi:polyisoprenyl-phosphate glycosyltransferase